MGYGDKKFDTSKGISSRRQTSKSSNLYQKTFNDIFKSNNIFNATIENDIMNINFVQGAQIILPFVNEKDMRSYRQLQTYIIEIVENILTILQLEIFNSYSYDDYW